MEKKCRILLVAHAFVWLMLVPFDNLLAQTNLVPNGTFLDGNHNFGSDYIQSYGLGGDNDTGKYCVSLHAHDNSTSMFNFYDHTTNNGQQKYMVVNGSTNSGQRVWYNKIDVQPHSYYDFTLWMTNLSYGGGYFSYMRSKLKIKINNVVVVDSYEPPVVYSNRGYWNQLPTVQWYSRNATTALIEIYDLCTYDNGNDFGLDDIGFFYQYTNVVEANDDYVTTCFETPVDINPMQNPCIRGKLIQPSTAEEFVDRNQDFAHKIDKDDYCKKVFTSYRFRWGGNWRRVKDYQHFER